MWWHIIVVVGLCCLAFYGIRRANFIDGTIKQILLWGGCILLILWLLDVFGVVHTPIRWPRW